MPQPLSATTLAATTQEVLLRTLTSDIASIQHGDQTPVPVHYTAQFSEKNESSAPTDPNAHKGLHLILALLFLAAVGVGFYYYVYPSLTQLTP